MADELKPCPFPHIGNELLRGNMGRKYWVHCPCGAMGPTADSPAEADAAWNRRSTSERDSARDAALEEAARKLVQMGEPGSAGIVRALKGKAND